MLNLKRTWLEKNNWTLGFENAPTNAPTMVCALTANACAKLVILVLIVPWWRWAMILAKTIVGLLGVQKQHEEDVGWANVFATQDFKARIVPKY